jgi:hypothetical protein
MTTLDDILKPVCIAFNVDDPGKLPAAVKSKYEEVKNNLTNVPGMSEDQVAAALGPALVDGSIGIFNGHPEAMANAIQNTLKGIMVTAGGPVGAAFVAGSDMLVSILGTIGGTAHGVGDNWAPKPGEIWYGGWQIAGGNLTHKPPKSAINPVTFQPDPRWIPWTNSKTKSYQIPDTANGNKPVVSDGKPVYRSDDMPTIPNVIAYPDTGVPVVTGQFYWLPAVLNGVPKVLGGTYFPYPKDSFDYAFAHALTVALEQYLNVQGPSLTYDSPPPHNAMNLRDMLENMLQGWNSIHLPGNKILLNDPKRVKSTTATTTFANKTTTTTTLDAPDLIPQNPKIGDLATAIIMRDPRDWQWDGDPSASFGGANKTGYVPDYPIYLHTGPLLQSIGELFSMKPAPAQGVVLRPVPKMGPTGTQGPVVILRPGIVKPKQSSNPTIDTGFGAAIGFLVGGPIGGALGALGGWLFSKYRNK